MHTLRYVATVAVVLALLASPGTARAEKKNPFAGTWVNTKNETGLTRLSISPMLPGSTYMVAGQGSSPQYMLPPTPATIFVKGYSETAGRLVARYKYSSKSGCSRYVVMQIRGTTQLEVTDNHVTDVFKGAVRHHIFKLTK